MEKTAAADCIDQFIILTPPVRRMDGAHVRRLKTWRQRVSIRGSSLLRCHPFHAFRIDSRERREIVFANHHLCRPHHRRFIQRIRVVAHVARQKWRTNRCPIYTVTIGFRTSGFPGMKVGRGFGHFQNSNRCGQTIVKRPRPVLQRNRRCGRKSRNLSQRMNSRVGAPRTLRQYIFSAQPSNG